MIYIEKIRHPGNWLPSLLKFMSYPLLLLHSSLKKKELYALKSDSWYVVGFSDVLMIYIRLRSDQRPELTSSVLPPPPYTSSEDSFFGVKLLYKILLSVSKLPGDALVYFVSEYTIIRSDLVCPSFARLVCLSLPKVVVNFTSMLLSEHLLPIY